MTTAKQMQEMCAKVCEKIASDESSIGRRADYLCWADVCAAAIRAIPVEGESEDKAGTVCQNSESCQYLDKDCLMVGCYRAKLKPVESEAERGARLAIAAAVSCQSDGDWIHRNEILAISIHDILKGGK